MSLVKERTMVHKTTEAIFYLIDSSSMLYILKISLNFTVSLSSAVILPLDYISHCQGDQFVSFFTLFFLCDLALICIEFFSYQAGVDLEEPCWQGKKPLRIKVESFSSVLVDFFF